MGERRSVALGIGGHGAQGKQRNRLRREDPARELAAPQAQDATNGQLRVVSTEIVQALTLAGQGQIAKGAGESVGAPAGRSPACRVGLRSSCAPR